MDMRTKFLTACIVVSFCLTTLNALGGAKVRFVSPQGNDSNAGTALEKPLRSINAAIIKSSAGDTIYVLSGTYREIISFESKVGVPENPICLMGYARNEEAYPVIDGGATEPSSNATNDWMHITDSQWLEIARLKFRNGWTLPIKVVRSSYLTFRSCVFWGGKRVINGSTPATHHILVEDCSWDQGGEYLWKLEKDNKGVAAWTSMHHEALEYFNGSLIDFHGTGGSVVIRRNTIVNAFNAVRFRGEPGCDSNVEIYENHVSNIRDNDFEPEYYTYNLHIYHNVSHNVHRTLSIDGVEGGQIYYYGNVVTADADAWTKTICSGIWKVKSSSRLLSHPVYAFNNSFYSSGEAFSKMGGTTKKLHHFNNAYVFFGDGHWLLPEWESDNSFDFDISNMPWPATLTQNGQEQHGILADAQFVDPTRGDVRLKPGSAAIDVGKVVELPELDWSQSFNGKAPDLGAFEDGRLVEGPAFRFMTPPGSRVEYKEKPRIVRCRSEENRVSLYFSDKINPASVKKDDIELYRGDTRIKMSSVSCSRNNYELVLETEALPAVGEISLQFKNLPKGLNGETVTMWASAAKLHR